MFSVPIGSSAAPSRPSRAAAAAAALTDPMASTKKKIVAKLVLLGESGVGKTSLVHRFLEGHFVEKEATIGCVFLTKDLAVDGYTVHFDIWDTAGQERYNSLAPLFYRGASAAVVVYDITKEASYFRAKGWVEKLENDGEAKPDIVVALAGNKADLLEARQVRSEEADAYAWLMGLLFTETSARTGYNVDEIFFEIAKKLVNAQPPENQLEGMNLSQDGNKNAANKSSCCY